MYGRPSASPRSDPDCRVVDRVALCADRGRGLRQDLHKVQDTGGRIRGSSAGLKQFCQGLGEATIDIANSSRPIKEAEVKECTDKGVKNIMEVRFGYDGIVFASSAKGPDIALEPKDVYLALAEQIPVDGKLVANPNKTWKEVNANLPDWKIVAFIPGEKHGTREVFEEKVLIKGCEDTGGIKLHEAAGLDAKAAGKACAKVRKDGGAVDIDGDYTETLARLQSNPQSIGVFGLAFYENNTDKLKVATMSGVTPSVETISTGKYPVSRPLFFYVKKDHIGVIPGLKEYGGVRLSSAAGRRARSGPEGSERGQGPRQFLVSDVTVTSIGGAEHLRPSGVGMDFQEGERV